MYAQQVLIEAPGFAAVEIDVAAHTASTANTTALAGGSPVSRSSTLGSGGGSNAGACTRMKVALPNGSAVFVTYDARLAAKVRGRVALVTADRIEIIASEAGEVNGAFQDHMPPATV